MKEDIKPPRTEKNVMNSVKDHNEVIQQPPGTFKKERKKKKKQSEVHETTTSTTFGSSSSSDDSVCTERNATTFGTSVPSQRFDPSPFQIKGRPIVKKTPAPPPPRRRISNLKTPAPPPPRRPVVSKTVENLVPEEPSVTEQKLRTRNEELCGELEKRRRELEQSNRKL